MDDLPPFEGDKENVNEGKGLKILTPNKFLTRLPVLLTKIKAGNNSYKLKNDIRQIVHLLYQHNEITKKVGNHCNNGKNMVLIRKPKTFDFDFDFPKDIDKNLKHETGFTIKSNESLAENNKKAWKRY